MCGIRRHRHSLIKQPVILITYLKGPLYKAEIGIIRNHRFRERGELHTLVTKLDNFLDDLVYCAFTAVKNWAELYGGGFDDSHLDFPYECQNVMHPGCDSPKLSRFLREGTS